MRRRAEHTCLLRHAPGILNPCRYPIHTGRLEGVNNKITVVKRIAYGYRDQLYFILKIKDAFRGSLPTTSAMILKCRDTLKGQGRHDGLAND
jgi:hypothetical protein